VREVPSGRQRDQLAVEAPREALEGNLVGCGSNHQDGETRDLVDHVVADSGKLLFAARHLPHALPELLDLEVVDARET
jgi:hypothetical protein